jgi:integrase/recombinase XerC
MARHAEGWKLAPPDHRTGIHPVRFTFQGRRRQISTGRRDPTEASIEAARIYAEVVSGRYRPDLVIAKSAAPARPGTPLDETASLWLADFSADHDETTVETYGIYVATHWQPFFGSLDRMVTPTINDYTRARLRKVIRGTVLKELSALRGFVAWCFEKGHIRELPIVEAPPAKATGTPDTTRPHKLAPVELSEKQIAAFVKALPEWSDGKWGKRRFRVRAAMEFSYETGLRAETVRSIVGADFVEGKLRIRDEADKARWGRTLPLSDRARKILAGIGAKDLEPFFGRHDYRAYIEAACTAAKIPQLSPHDLRHARGSHLVDRTADLRGGAFLLGHKEITTMNRYARPTEKAAERALATERKKRRTR